MSTITGATGQEPAPTTGPDTGSDSTDKATTPAPSAGAKPGTEDQGEADDGDLSPDDLRAALTKARKEAARYRTERNELRPLAEKARQVEEANKTELEKAQEKLAALEAEATEAKQSALRSRVASAKGVPESLLSGTTEEELTAAADALLEFAGTAKEQSKSKGAPYVPSVGRSSGGDDRDSMARQILGL
jgi:hypothetical protein